MEGNVGKLLVHAIVILHRSILANRHAVDGAKLTVARQICLGRAVVVGSVSEEFPATYIEETVILEAELDAAFVLYALAELILSCLLYTSPSPRD